MDGSTAKRIDSDLQSSGSNGLEINDRGQLFDVLTQIIVGARNCPRTAARQPPDAGQTLLQEDIRRSFDPRCRFRSRRSSMWRIVFQSAIFGRIVGGGDDNPVGEAIAA